jgi:hypothetical protein
VNWSGGVGREEPVDPVHYRRVRAAASEIADVVGYQSRGRASSEPGGLPWKLRDDAR